jgi:hypothetical protein
MDGEWVKGEQNNRWEKVKVCNVRDGAVLLGDEYLGRNSPGTLPICVNMATVGEGTLSPTS